MMTWLNCMLANILFGFKKFAKDERGDTNFISILIILAIVVILAGLFIGFKDQIVEQVQGIIDGFTIH